MYSECEDEVPQDYLEEANVVSLNLLPLKSREKYEKEYQLFKCWMETRQIRKICEEVPSTLWSKYSMLRSTLQSKDNIDIKFLKLVAFLKRKSAGYKAKKANTFSRGDINKFIAEAPDETYLHI
ncbi:hypothetical protein NQ315_003981 [Exocentrus adspersus]|uniref:Uncharacterized protein n=1 Tax=Exocentrus adspersus TaxID=1586481 RepID=A0AAV8VBX4_9CUCU|nr:hypothetical protein NQ315_003981 [Exocentrus adspersus]